MNTPKISFAPMEGITTYLFRNAFAAYYKGVDTFYSPFLSNEGMSHKEKMDICPENNQNITLIPQVLTNRPEVFLSLANQLKDMGYSEVNLNLGCPSGTVVAKNKGAGCLKDLAALERFLAEIFEKSPVDISVKTRIGLQDLTEWNAILQLYQKFPIKELTIHPRLQKEFYRGTVHRESYALAAKEYSRPLCYNGDIVTPESYLALMEQFPDISHIMIGRRLLQDPTLAEKIHGITCTSPADTDSPTSLPGNNLTPMNEQSFGKPSSADLQRFRDFHDEILENYVDYMSGDTPVLFKMKELWIYFSAYAPLSDKEKKVLRKCSSVREYKLLMQNHFRELL